MNVLLVRSFDLILFSGLLFDPKNPNCNEKSPNTNKFRVFVCLCFHFSIFCHVFFFEFRFNFEFVLAFVVIGDFSDKFEIKFACKNFSLFSFLFFKIVLCLCFGFFLLNFCFLSL